jgi:gamma-glutamylputrescine oxidase
MNASHTTSLSYWEQSTFLQADIIVIGAGIVGLSAALNLKRLNPTKKILVLERGVLPTGASTKNAGFSCFGSLSEIAADLEILSEEDVLSLISMRWNGLQLLRKTIGDKEMGYEEHGSFEVFTPTQELLYQRSMQLLDRFNQHLKQIIGVEQVFQPTDEYIETFGFKGVQHLIRNSAEGQIDTGSTMNALLQLVRNAGVQVLTGVEITSYQSTNNRVELQTHELGKLSCQQLLFCTNGFAAQLLPDIDVKPGRAQVLITSEIPNLKLKGCFHMEEGYYYFRNVGNRVLFGGGRNLDKAGETTYSHEITPFIQNQLNTYLKEVILPDVEYSVEMRWAGTLGLGKNRLPIVQKIEPGVYCAVRMGGMGVAIGSLIGKQAAELLMNQ